MLSSSSSNKAFSLVELMGVLTIIGVILAGVLAATPLIRQAAFRQTMADMQLLSNQVLEFKDIYSAYPGDFNQASSLLGAGASNGDGDGVLEYEQSSNGTLEAVSALEHLALAQLSSHSYSGEFDAGFVVGTNVMGSDIEGSAMYVRCCADQSTSRDYDRELSLMHHVLLFAVDGTDSDYRAGVLTPTEAMQFDRKLDDGNPDAGFVGAQGAYIAASYGPGNCYSNSGATAIYNVTTTDKDLPGCQLLVSLDR